MTQEKEQEKKQEQKHVYTDAHPEYPKALYNHETRETKAAADKEAEDKLAKAGFVKEPLPPLDPVSLTPAEIKQLQELLAKAAKALDKLGQLSGETPTHPKPKSDK